MNFKILPSAKVSSAPFLVRFIPSFTRSTDPDLKDLLPTEFSGKKLTSAVLRNGRSRTVLVGIGEAQDVCPHLLRKAAGTAVRILKRLGAERAAFRVTGHEEELAAIVEGIEAGAYEFDDYTRRSGEERQLKEVELLVDAGAVRVAAEAVGRGSVVGQAVNYVRDIGNQPGNVVTPAVLADKAAAAARKYGLKLTVFDRAKLEKGGFNGILAVGGGSRNEPRLIVLEYRGARSREARPLALVGKAITFDSGGISIKPGEKMDEMKFDKMGGVAVLGAICAIAALKLPVNVVALVSAAENLPDANAYRPGDIIRSWDGKTIEVLNTDAEGRIVLADAIAYARETYKPAAIVDLATLTGACIIALGEYKAGLFTNSDDLLLKIQASAEESGEPLWHLPLGAEYHEQIKSDVAWVKNTGGRYGGAITGAAFLETWAEKTPWAHLDIAGVAWTTKVHPHLSKGATGYGVRLLVELARTYI